MFDYVLYYIETDQNVQILHNSLLTYHPHTYSEFLNLMTKVFFILDKDGFFNYEEFCVVVNFFFLSKGISISDIINEETRLLLNQPQDLLNMSYDLNEVSSWAPYFESTELKNPIGPILSKNDLNRSINRHIRAAIKAIDEKNSLANQLRWANRILTQFIESQLPTPAEVNQRMERKMAMQEFFSRYYSTQKLPPRPHLYDSSIPSPHRQEIKFILQDSSYFKGVWTLYTRIYENESSTIEFYTDFSLDSRRKFASGYGILITTEDLYVLTGIFILVGGTAFSLL